jgi:hypothetical protein
MRQGLQQGCATALERLAIDGVIGRRARRPTPRAEAKPWAGHGPHGRLRCLAFVTLWLVLDGCPVGMTGGGRRPRHNRLAQNLGTLEPPVAPGLLLAAFRHGRHPGLWLEGLGRRVALAWFPPQTPRRRGAQTAPAPGKASSKAPAGCAWARGAMALAPAAMPGTVTRRGATSAGTSRAWGGRTPSSVGRAAARLRAARRAVMTAAERTGWGRNKRSSGVRRARCAA